MTGYFTILGLADEPFMYDVSVVRNGGNYCVRSVQVWQGDESQVCFSGMCSFKRPEPNFLSVQEPQNMEKKYSSILAGKKVKDLPIRNDFKDMRYVSKY
jgi:acyl-CoA thioesterase